MDLDEVIEQNNIYDHNEKYANVSLNYISYIKKDDDKDNKPHPPDPDEHDDDPPKKQRSFFMPRKSGQTFSFWLSFIISFISEVVFVLGTINIYNFFKIYDLIHLFIFFILYSLIWVAWVKGRDDKSAFAKTNLFLAAPALLILYFYIIYFFDTFLRSLDVITSYTLSLAFFPGLIFTLIFIFLGGLSAIALIVLILFDIYTGFCAGFCNKGYDLINQDKYKEAKIIYDLMIKINSKDPIAWNNRGVALYRLNKFDESVRCFDKAIAVNQSYKNAWNNKGISHYNLDEYDEAVRCFNKVTMEYPYYADAWNNKGVALRRLGNYDEAIRCFDEALRIDSQYGAAWYNKGNSFFDQSSYHEAIQSYNVAIKIDPLDIATWNNFSLVLQAQGNLEDARKCTERSLNIFRDRLGENHPYTVAVRENLESLKSQM